MSEGTSGETLIDALEVVDRVDGYIGGEEDFDVARDIEVRRDD